MSSLVMSCSRHWESCRRYSTVKGPGRCSCYDMTLMICPVSGFIHEHRDRYIAQSGSLCGQRLQPVAVLLDFSKAAGDDAHLRANIVVQMEELEPRAQHVLCSA